MTASPFVRSLWSLRLEDIHLPILPFDNERFVVFFGRFIAFLTALKFFVSFFSTGTISLKFIFDDENLILLERFRCPNTREAVEAASASWLGNNVRTNDSLSEMRRSGRNVTKSDFKWIISPPVFFTFSTLAKLALFFVNLCITWLRSRRDVRNGRSASYLNSYFPSVPSRRHGSVSTYKPIKVKSPHRPRKYSEDEFGRRSTLGLAFMFQDKFLMFCEIWNVHFTDLQYLIQ